MRLKNSRGTWRSRSVTRRMRHPMPSRRPRAWLTCCSCATTRGRILRLVFSVSSCRI